jgi:eukaryotic-like serine/threonine-protein kinase
LGPLGRGTAGDLLLARPPARLGLTAELVIIKVLDGIHDPARFRRMSQELQLFASIDSPYLMQLYDAGSDDGMLWYSMEHCALGSLAQPAVPLTAAEQLALIAQACRGVHDLHEAGVAHRDLKPAKIFLTEGGAKVADLELARFLEPGMTVTTAAPIGDLEYIDPALLRGERASRATDIWALGITLHVVLTGTSVYPGLTEETGVLPAVRRVLSSPPELSPDLDPDIAALVRACTSPDPADRPPTAAVLADRIEAL